jgi:DNA-binding MarR family transcriptional regulator
MSKPFASMHVEALLNLVRSADLCSREVDGVLAAHGLTRAQYNVLRILRGAGDQALTCSEIGDRLITFDADVTRLLDKLESRGFVARQRTSEDRRKVTVRLTTGGAAVASDAALECSLNDLHQRQFAACAGDDLPRLIDLLERIRVRSPT